MKIRCLVVDDEKLAQEVLIHHISKFDNLQLEGTCTNVFELISFLNKNKAIDLIFLDIKMPEISGIDFVALLAHPPAIIFTTAYNHYAVEAFNKNALDYLLKPISLERFSQSVQKASLYIRPATSTPAIPANTSNFFYVKSDKRLIKIDPAELLYIEGMRNYICLYTETEKIVVHSTLLVLEENVKQVDYICRVHKSFLINLTKIQYIEQHCILLKNKKSIPIGLSYRDQVYEKMKII